MTCWGCSLGRNDDTCLDSERTCLDKVNPDILAFALQQHKDGKSADTIRTTIGALKLTAQYADLYKPEDVKLFLAEAKYKNTTKTKIVYAYTGFAKSRGIQWTPPKYKIIHKLPFIPTEEEIDALIASSSPLLRTVLLMLKETGMRIGELTQLQWNDIDVQRKTVNITPEKGSNARILPITDKLIGLLTKLPHRHENRVFQPRKNMLRDYLCHQRRDLANRLGNPRIQQIGFHTLRHWKGTMEYYQTKDIIHVQQVLGHKSITSTMVYINITSAIFAQINDNFIGKVAHNDKEELELINAGFEHVNNRGELALYRKRK